MVRSHFHSFRNSFEQPSQKLRDEKAFTLVELLVVVSIIGILSTVGIPTYRKMVQKARKSEARTLLGGLYTAEAAFYSEYGAYGTQIDKIGFEVDGGVQFYTVGFPTAACASQAEKPTVATTVGAAIQQSFPSYYSPTNGTVQRSVVAKAGQTVCQAGVMPNDGASFTATASGIIGFGLPVTSPITDQDVWTMDQARISSNIRDGVK